MRRPQRTLAASIALAVAMTVTAFGTAYASTLAGLPTTEARIMSADDVIKGPAGGVGTVTARNISYAPDVQVIDRPDALVVWETDPDGAGYTLDGDFPGVSSLAVGKVMLIKDEAMGRVRELSRQADRVHVRVDPVGITDVLQNGDLTWTGAAADQSHMGAFAWDDPDGVINNSLAVGNNNLVRPEQVAAPEVKTLVAPGAGEPSTASAQVNVGGSGGYAMMVACSASVDSFEASLEMSRPMGTGEVVATAELNITGLTSSGSIRVTNGKVVTAQFNNDVIGTMNVALKATKGTAGALEFNQTINLPVEAYWPVYVGGIPFTVSVRPQLTIASKISAGGTVLDMNTSFGFGGRGTTVVSNGIPGGSGNPTIENRTSIDGVAGTSDATSGSVAFRPRFGFGLGTGAIHTAAFVDFVASAAVTSVAPCRTLTVVLTPRVGADRNLQRNGSVEYVKQLGQTTFTDYSPKVPACQPK